MSNEPSDGSAPFARDRLVDKPSIIGARWWHEALVDRDAEIARRTAIRNILIAGGVIAGFGAMLAMCATFSSDSDAPATSDARKTSLDMQKEYGWSFGAVGEPLVFDGITTKPFEPDALRRLPVDLAPASKSLLPFFQATLFQSPDAQPPSLGKLDVAEVSSFQLLSAVMKPIFTPAMDAAYARGKSLASLFASLGDAAQMPATARAALLVDLPGPEAVAFAAGASSMFDPVFLFDNWPHPRGVVRAHETLSAAASYQPLFAEARRKAKAGRLPMFVLDRRRISTYTDDAREFDNRYVAKLPTSAAAMRALDVSHVLYVVPKRTDASRELDDLNDELVLYGAGGLDVKAVSLDMFDVDADAGISSLADRNDVFYGGSTGSHHAFFVDYPWAKPARPATTRPASNPGKSFVPRARVTPYSSGNPSGAVTSKPRPTSFATVPVVIAVGTGVILGARYQRNGSWNRSSGGFGG
ncbi:MAG: hypothetical protein QOI41_2724 [Myxococcales bacterium]|nr:hypothetical protein [Myxococcales bacterium]